MSTDLGPATNPYLLGNYAPVHDERDDAPLEIVGDLPASLRGRYLRNGPNPAFEPLGNYHLFDGDGMIHGIEIADGAASYHNRYIESAGLAAERRAGNALFGGLAEFRFPPAELMAEVGVMKNTANTNIISHAGRLLALMEACPPIELAADLTTSGPWDFGGALTGAMTAHPKIDPATGEMLFFGYGPFPPYLRFHVVDASGVLTTSVDIDLPAPVMMHDFVVSATKVVFFDLPALFDLDAMLSGGTGIRWEPANGARIGILDRAQPEAGVTWIEVDPFFAFHFLNGHDDGDAVVVEGCRSPRLNAAFGNERLDEPITPLLHRWRVDPVAGTVTDTPLDDRFGDFPRIDDRMTGRRARYGYVATGQNNGSDDVMFNGFIKHDLVTNSSTEYSFGPDVMSGEVAFAADPDRDSEDGGWLMTFATDASGDSALIIVDAEALQEVARVRVPRRVPFGFHGNWFAA